DAPVRLIGRPDYSGTHRFFEEKVVKRGDQADPASFAPTVEAVEESVAVVARVAADPHAIGYVGLGWVDDRVRAVPLAPGAGAAPVAPSTATVLDGSYPVYRPLLAYTRGAPAGAIAAFLRFVLGPDGQALVAAHGFTRADVDVDA